MKKIKLIVSVLFVTTLLGVNISVISNAASDYSIEILNKAEARNTCYYFSWQMEDMGTGFGCSESSAWCSDSIDFSNCVIYRYTGKPLIIVT